jgi:glyoxylase-like metal-dependent hydrolase (beta-lactamase superfamily II)
MRLAAGLHRFDDTCHVYLLSRGPEAIAIDFGAGDVLDHLGDLGIDRITDVLMTHHHRDQGQGLARAVDAGIRIWAPPLEQDLFAAVDEHWQRRGVDDYYNLRQDRFSLIAPVPLHGLAPEYRTARIGGFDVTTVPTPGHTTGSVSYFIDLDGRRLAFIGDLMSGPGRVWSLAATQWTYTGHEGVASTILSLHEVRDRAPDLLLPSHGEPITDAPVAISLTETRLRALYDLCRATPWDPQDWRDRPYEMLSPHLLRNRTANAQSFALLSDSGGALLFDFGYDLDTGWPAGEDRAARRPLLNCLRVLKRDFGVDRVEVAIPTHYHDDHVAGFNLLRDVEGAQIWAEAGIAAILADPRRFDLPCLYHDPIRTDLVMAPGRAVRWREYELTLYPLPGHCLHAVAISTHVDGAHVLATGDQQDGGWIRGERPELLNYQYKNGFQPDDFIASAELYQRIRPDLMLSGHWGVRRVDDAYLEHLLTQGETLARLHRQLLDRGATELGAGDFVATIYPYRSQVAAGEEQEIEVEVVNPFARAATAQVAVVVPAGWCVRPDQRDVDLAPRSTGRAPFVLRAPAAPVRRAVIAADVSIDQTHFGQHAEALIDVRPGRSDDAAD